MKRSWHGLPDKKTSRNVIDLLWMNKNIRNEG